MLNFRVQKVCEMIGESATEYLKDKANAPIPIFTDTPNFTEDVKLEINNMVTLLSFSYLAQNKEIKPKKALGKVLQITDSIFLNPYAVVTCLEEIHATQKNKICFFKWYMEEWVNFYCKHDKEYFCILNTLNIIAGNAYTISAIDRFLLMQVPDEIIEKTVKQCAAELNRIFDLFCTIAKKMVLDQNRLHIPFAKQFHNLKFLDLNMDFINKLNEMDVSEEENKPIEKENIEKRKITEVKKSAANIIKDVPALEKNDQYNLKEEKEKYSKQMEKYMINGDFIGTIEGKELQEFLSIASKLYSSTRVHLLKEKLIANNSRIKEERRREAIYKIIHEEDREYYDYLCDLNDIENANSPYSFYISNTLNKIEALIEDIEQNPDEVLVELYLEETRDLLANMRICLPKQTKVFS